MVNDFALVRFRFTSKMKAHKAQKQRSRPYFGSSGEKNVGFGKPLGGITIGTLLSHSASHIKCLGPRLIALVVEVWELEEK
jgi:hypothetical protein